MTRFLMPLIIWTLLPCLDANSVCIGHLSGITELNSHPAMVRDAADRRWDAGGVVDLWTLQCNGRKILDTGVYSAWNVQNGANHYGVHIGLGVIDLAPALSILTDSLGLGSLWPPLAKAGSFVSVEGFVGYRPTLPKDLVHHVPYGFMIQLSIPFGVKNLAPPGL